MKCTLFLPYYGFNDADSNLDDFYKDSDAYIQALNNYSMTETQMMETKSKQDDVQYAKCECTLYDSDNNEMTVDKLVSYYDSNKLIMLMVELDLDTEEEEFDSELNGWVNEHKRLDMADIMKTLDEGERFAIEPKRDVKLTFNNLANKETYCTLVNTMLFEKIDSVHYVFIVDKIIFTKNF